MAIGWLGAVKAVPWGDVIAAAPTVVQGANALWDRVAGKRRREDAPPPVPPEGGVDARTAALEHAVVELQKEAQAASQLIRSLAGQNAQLVREIGALRLRIRVLAVAGAGGLVVAGVALATVLSR